ncbi:MAG: hypothetical protein H7A46_12395 [Verrucomicrobiales bacterium]|nr:hypothetical protein [Verrucomicrobiales bacterium]
MIAAGPAVSGADYPESVAAKAFFSEHRMFPLLEAEVPGVLYWNAPTAGDTSDWYPDATATDPSEWYPMLGVLESVRAELEVRLVTLTAPFTIDQAAQRYECLGGPPTTGVAALDFNFEIRESDMPHGLGAWVWNEPQGGWANSGSLARRWLGALPATGSGSPVVEGGSLIYAGRADANHGLSPDLPDPEQRPLPVAQLTGWYEPEVKVQESNQPSGNAAEAIPYRFSAIGVSQYDFLRNPDRPCDPDNFVAANQYPIGRVTGGEVEVFAVMTLQQNYRPKTPARYVLDRMDDLVASGLVPDTSTTEQRKRFADQGWDATIRLRSTTAETSSRNLALRDCEYFFRGLAGGYANHFVFLEDFNDLANNTVLISTPIYNAVKALNLALGFKRGVPLEDAEIVARLFNGQVGYPLPGTPSDGLLTGYGAATLGYALGMKDAEMTEVRSTVAAQDDLDGILDVPPDFTLQRSLRRPGPSAVPADGVLMKLLEARDPLPPPPATSPEQPLAAMESYHAQDASHRIDQDYFGYAATAGARVWLALDLDSGGIAVEDEEGGPQALAGPTGRRVVAPTAMGNGPVVGARFAVVAAPGNRLLSVTVEGPFEGFGGTPSLYAAGQRRVIEPGAVMDLTQFASSGTDGFVIEGVWGDGWVGQVLRLGIVAVPTESLLIGVTSWYHAMNWPSSWADLDQDLLPDWWELLYSGSTVGLMPDEDDDGDGLTGLGELAFGGIPGRADAAGLRLYRVAKAGELVLEYPMGDRLRLAYRVETATTIAGPWNDVTGEPLEADDQSGLPVGYRRMQLRLTPGQSPGEMRGFYRVVSEPTP